MFYLVSNTADEVFSDERIEQLREQLGVWIDWGAESMKKLLHPFLYVYTPKIMKAWEKWKDDLRAKVREERKTREGAVTKNKREKKFLASNQLRPNM